MHNLGNPQPLELCTLELCLQDHAASSVTHTGLGNLRNDLEIKFAIGKGLAGQEGFSVSNGHLEESHRSGTIQPKSPNPRLSEALMSE